MTHRLANICAAIIAIWAFAAIGLEANSHHGSTHSGTQTHERY